MPGQRTVVCVMCLTAMSISLAACASGPYRVEGRGDGWASSKLDARWQRGAIRIDAPRVFESGDCPFAGVISCPRPAVVVFRTVTPEGGAQSVIGQWVDQLNEPTWRTPILADRPYQLVEVEGGSTGTHATFRVRRTSEDGTSEWIVPGDSAHYVIELSGSFGLEVCDFHVAVVRGSPASEFHWYTPVLAIITFPLFVIAQLGGGGLN